MSQIIPCEMDTKPMAETMSSVSNHVAATTAAVVTMQGAVIAAERKGAQKVCRNVNRGFLTMMRSQISQKVAYKKSRVDALLFKLAQQKKRLLSIKANMEVQYNRIAERYLRIFSVINRELKTRLLQIDQPVFKFVNKDVAATSNRMNALSAWVSTAQDEDVALSQRLLAANVKANAEKAIRRSADFLARMGEQKRLTGLILHSQSSPADCDLLRVPVLIRESENDVSRIPRVDIFTPDSLDPTTASSLSDAVRSSSDLPWSDGSVQPELAERFASLMQSSSASSRVKDVAMRLFSSSNFKVI